VVPSVDLNLLIVFDAIMQDRSLTRAGRRLGLSQPATSHALARLRAALDDELFVRTPQGMQPTLQAEQMAEPVREALRLMQSALAPDVFDPATSTRTFNLLVNNYAARAVVPPLAMRVADHAPSVGPDIKAIGNIDVLDQLDRGVDVALTQLVDGGERFKCIRILEDDFVALLDKNHPAATEAVFTMEHLANIPQVLMHLISPNVPLVFDRWGIDPFRDRFEITLHTDGTVRGLGGVKTVGDDCETVVPGLFVAGDNAAREPVAGAISGGGNVNSAWALSSGRLAGRAAAARSRRPRVRSGHLVALGRAGLRPSGSARPVDLAPVQEAMPREMQAFDRALFRSAAGLDAGCGMG
jgi:DNA-binding transcriptional LysR family regulator